jgi:hypothetical protein
MFDQNVCVVGLNAISVSEQLRMESISRRRRTHVVISRNEAWYDWDTHIQDSCPTFVRLRICFECRRTMSENVAWCG